MFTSMWGPHGAQPVWAPYAHFAPLEIIFERVVHGSLSAHLVVGPLEDGVRGISSFDWGIDLYENEPI